MLTKRRTLTNTNDDVCFLALVFCNEFSYRRPPLFCFGHGLSYTTFAYGNIKASASAVSFDLTNTGNIAGAEVAQLYLGFPAAAGEPPQQLKGFEKVALKAGETKTVTFALAARDLSVYSEAAAGWQLVSGKFTARVGASSRDIRLNATFTTV